MAELSDLNKLKAYCLLLRSEAEEGQGGTERKKMKVDAADVNLPTHLPAFPYDVNSINTSFALRREGGVTTATLAAGASPSQDEDQADPSDLGEGTSDGFVRKNTGEICKSLHMHFWALLVSLDMIVH